MGRMTIGRFAREAGVGVETVRYYQRRGLLPVPAHGATAYREYDDALLRRVRFIRQVQAAGFTLEEIRDLLRLDRTRERPRVRRIAARKLGELDGRIRELRRLQRALREVVHDCEHGDPGSPCPIIESFERGASAGAGRPDAARTGKIRACSQVGIP